MRIKTYGCVDRCPISTRYLGISSIVFDQNSIKLSAFPRGKRGGMTADVRTVSPNITGAVNLCNGWGGVEDTGVFKKTGQTQSAGGGYANGTNLQFDASWSSSLFGVASTVQPPSLQSLACIKT